MLKLIKYEFIRKYRLFAIAMVSALIINLLLIFNMRSEGAMVFVGLFPVVLSILYIVDIIKMYSDDLNKKSGYMIFMTSNSGYSIVFAKITTAVIEGVAVVLIIAAAAIANACYFSWANGYSISFNLMDFINNILYNSLGINFGHVLLMLFTMLMVFLTFILTVYTAMTIRKSIFAEIKFGGILSFIIFILLNWGGSYIVESFSDLFGSNYTDWLYNSLNVSTINPSVWEMFMVLLPSIVLMVVFCSVMSVVSGYLLEKKINL